jgi:hypothetical protein
VILFIIYKYLSQIYELRHISEGFNSCSFKSKFLLFWWRDMNMYLVSSVLSSRTTALLACNRAPVLLFLVFKLTWRNEFLLNKSQRGKGLESLFSLQIPRRFRNFCCYSNPVCEMKKIFYTKQALLYKALQQLHKMKNKFLGFQRTDHCISYKFQTL